jgi:Rrf2 family iron-sulfur cluster assembly transcriptional regulator
MLWHRRVGSPILESGMRFSLQFHYAVCGLFDLAYNGLDQPVQVRVMSDRQQIPARYLEQIFQRLRRAGLVSGKRGPGGGYRLARLASEISLREVVTAVEGPLGESVASLDRSGTGALGRPEFLWSELAERFSDVLDSISLADLCQRAAKEGVPRLSAPVPDYQI